MLMLEECRLRLVDNSVSVRLGGLCGRGGGGGIATGSAGESVVQVDHDGAAAAHGGIMRRCLNMSKILGMPARAVAQLATRYWFSEDAHRLERDKVQNKPTVEGATRDLMTTRARIARNPPGDRTQDRASAGRACTKGWRGDRMGDQVRRDGPIGVVLPNPPCRASHVAASRVRCPA
jgi:hypothetical protein